MTIEFTPQLIEHFKGNIQRQTLELQGQEILVESAREKFEALQAPVLKIVAQAEELERQAKELRDLCAEAQPAISQVQQELGTLSAHAEQLRTSINYHTEELQKAGIPT